jgi:N-acetylglucosaminyldiphosphoundecaprenol N-acetyl-beta-D-mannosaminyltransferase
LTAAPRSPAPARGLAGQAARPAADPGGGVRRPAPEVSLFGLCFDNLSMAEAVRRMDGYVRSGEPHLVFTPNVAMLIEWRRCARLKQIYRDVDLLTVDGMARLYASRLLGRPLTESLSGSSLFFQVMSLASAKGYRVFLLGARRGVLTAARSRLEAAFRPLHIVGTHHGYFGGERGGEVADLIRGARPDILLIGMSSPAKERFAWTFRARMNVPLVLGVGGMSDIAAGCRRAAPAWVRTACLEWLWRLAQEPRRLWRRYATSNTLFLWLLAREVARLAAARLGVRCPAGAAGGPPA